ncbi:MAG: hypothetical protein CMP10_04025 [Zetaproteobacteria bacterium]|nr:hypothetical protein [Pseudobdellovibrionaceae bacterium]
MGLRINFQSYRLHILVCLVGFFSASSSLALSGVEVQAGMSKQAWESNLGKGFSNLYEKGIRFWWEPFVRSRVSIGFAGDHISSQKSSADSAVLVGSEEGYLLSASISYAKRFFSPRFMIGTCFSKVMDGNIVQKSYRQDFLWTVSGEKLSVVATWFWNPAIYTGSGFYLTRRTLTADFQPESDGVSSWDLASQGLSWSLGYRF